MPQRKLFECDQKIQTVANAAVLIFLATRADSNDKRRFVGVRIFHSVALRPACILVFMRTAQGLFLYTRIPSAYACGYPRSYSNGADACSHILGFPRLMPVGILVVIRTALTLVLIYSDSPRLKFAACAENVGFYIQKCTVCDFIIAKSAQISDMTFYDSQFEM